MPSFLFVLTVQSLIFYYYFCICFNSFCILSTLSFVLANNLFVDVNRFFASNNFSKHGCNFGGSAISANNSNSISKT